jgi:Beta-lactamase
MKAVHAVCELTGDRYGYGLDIHADGFGHGGDMLGYVARMLVDSEAGIGVVALVNGLGGAWAMRLPV